MNTSKIFSICVAIAAAASVPSVADAQVRHSGPGAFHRSAPPPARTAPSAARPPVTARRVPNGPVGRTAGDRNWNRDHNGHDGNGNWHHGHGDWCDRNGHWHRGYWGGGWDNTIVIGGFGYPYGYGGYYPYDGYGYGYGGYGYAPAQASAGYYAGSGQRVYEGSTVGSRVDNSVVIQVQRRLARAGLYSGSIDGVIGNGTRRAIRSYERSHGLPVDGEIDNQLLATMGLA
jgi:hypothetical protein